MDPGVFTRAAENNRKFHSRGVMLYRAGEQGLQEPGAWLCTGFLSLLKRNRYSQPGSERNNFEDARTLQTGAGYLAQVF